MKSSSELFIGYYTDKYKKGEISAEELSQMVSDGIISEDEKQQIMSSGSGGSSQELDDLKYFHTEAMKLIGG